MTLTLVEQIARVLPGEPHLCKEILDVFKPYWLERVGKLTNDREQCKRENQLLREIIIELQLAKKFCCKCGG